MGRAVPVKLLHKFLEMNNKISVIILLFRTYLNTKRLLAGPLPRLGYDGAVNTSMRIW